MDFPTVVCGCASVTRKLVVQRCLASREQIFNLQCLQMFLSVISSVEETQVTYFFVSFPELLRFVFLTQQLSHEPRDRVDNLVTWPSRPGVVSQVRF